MRKVSVVLAVIFLVGAVVGCGSAASASSVKTSVSIVVSENLTRLDPHNQTAIPGYCAMDMIFDPLLFSDHKGNYTPGLATEWSYSDDGTEWTFKLREGVKFHNGEDFDADDVVATFQRFIDENTSLGHYTSWLTQLQSVEKIDDYEVKITLSSPYALFEQALSLAPIIPNEAYAEKGNALWNEQLMYGTGPWIFEEWVDGQHIKWRKNDQYWGVNDSTYEEVYMRFILEPSTAIAGQLSGEIDAYMPNGGIPEEMISQYDNYEATEMVSFQSTLLKYLGMQCGEMSAFKDKAVREAFSLAIDAQLLIDAFSPGGGIPSGILVPTCVGFDPDLPVYEFNPEKAKSVLASSSYAGEPIVLLSNTNVFRAEELLLGISQMANEVGFNTSVEITEFAVFSQRRANGEYTAFLTEMSITGGDIHPIINLRVLSNSHRHDYVNPELNGLIEKANVEMNVATRAALLTEVNRIIREEYAPMIGLVQMPYTYAINKDVNGIVYYPDGWYFFRNVGTSKTAMGD